MADPGVRLGDRGDAGHPVLPGRSAPHQRRRPRPRQLRAPGGTEAGVGARLRAQRDRRRRPGSHRRPGGGATLRHPRHPVDGDRHAHPAAAGLRHLAARPDLRHRARHDLVVAQLRRRRGPDEGYPALHRPHLAARRRDPHARRHVAGERRRLDAPDAQPARRVRHLQRAGPDEERDQPSHRQPSGPDAGQSPDDRGVDAHHQPARVAGPVLERGEHELVPAAHRRRDRAGRLLDRVAVLHLLAVADQEQRRQPQRRHLLRPAAGGDTDRQRQRLRALRGQRRDRHRPGDDGARDRARRRSGARPVRRHRDDRGRELSGLRAVRPREHADGVDRRIRPRHHQRHDPPADRQGLHVVLRARHGSPSTATRSSATTTPSTRGVSACRPGGRPTSSIPTCGRGSTSPIRPTGSVTPAICGCERKRWSRFSGSSARPAPSR